jgi:hypothetical protein
MSDVIDLSRDVNYRDIWKISLGKAKAVINPLAFKMLKERWDEFLKLIERGDVKESLPKLEG